MTFNSWCYGHGPRSWQSRLSWGKTTLLGNDAMLHFGLRVVDWKVFFFMSDHNGRPWIKFPSGRRAGREALTQRASRMEQVGVSGRVKGNELLVTRWPGRFFIGRPNSIEPAPPVAGPLAVSLSSYSYIRPARVSFGGIFIRERDETAHYSSQLSRWFICDALKGTPPPRSPLSLPRTGPFVVPFFMDADRPLLPFSWLYRIWPSLAWFNMVLLGFVDLSLDMLFCRDNTDESFYSNAFQGKLFWFVPFYRAFLFRCCATPTELILLKISTAVRRYSLYLTAYSKLELLTIGNIGNIKLSSFPSPYPLLDEGNSFAPVNQERRPILSRNTLFFDCCA